MNDLSGKEFELALRQCETEPIHQIGTIQPNGAVIVVSPDNRRVVLQTSENLTNFADLPPGDVCGKLLADLIGETAKAQVDKLIQVAEKKNTATGIVSLHRNHVLHALSSHVYFSDSVFVIELSLDEATQQDEKLAELLLEFQQFLVNSDSDSDMNKYLSEIAALVRNLTRYDSVMIYRFDTNWDGEIISQDRIETAPSYLGMHFPASDIPPQARRLYATNLVRVVADVEANPVPLIPALNPLTGLPLDMTYSALRSLSPIHIEYLRNIGVRASMVISLMQNGRLWGLIACHHMTPKRVTITMRETAIFISRMVSAKLSSFEAFEHQTKSDKANLIVNKLLKSITTQTEGAILQLLLPDLQTLMEATGIIVVIEGKRNLYGDVPSSKKIDSLFEWLGKQTSSEIFSCDYLGQQFPPAAEYADIASGLLATSLSGEMLNCIIWLRKEKLRTVNWAGKYEEGFVKNAAGSYRLTPRKSFQIWTESWRGRSTPWTHVEMGIAAMLALTLPESLSQKCKLEEEQSKLRQAEEEIRNLAFYDSLTKLPNRRLLADRLNQAMAASKRSGNYVALIFLDLDNFKPINDTHGHDVGDLLLIEAATRLKSCLREIDTASRFGGDEFVVVLNELDIDKAVSISQAKTVTEKIHSILSETYFLKTHNEKHEVKIVAHHCTCSIGMVVFSDHTKNEHDIIKYADSAMFEAKEAGRNQIRLYELND